MSYMCMDVELHAKLIIVVVNSLRDDTFCKCYRQKHKEINKKSELMLMKRATASV